MASSSRQQPPLEEHFAATGFHDTMRESLVFGDVTNDTVVEGFDDGLCLVGRFLTRRIIDFQAIQHRMASLWQPGRGIHVK